MSKHRGLVCVFARGKMLIGFIAALLSVRRGGIS